MTKRSIPLNMISIAAPCSANWNEMTGNDQVRFCQQCSLNVYNLSNMAQDQAEELIRNKEGRLCVRFYRRSDGTILTQNCPVGLQALKKKIARAATAIISAVLSFGASFGMFSYLTSKKTVEHPLIGSIAANYDPSPKNNYVQGEMAIDTNPIPKDELANSNSSSCSTTAPEMGKMVMGRVAANPVNEPVVEMGDIVIKTIVINRSEKELRQAVSVIVEPEIENDFTGQVIVEIEVDRAGNVINSQIISGDEKVNDACLDAVEQWKFNTSKLKTGSANVKGKISFRL
ncbi:MAG: energy transducer TonB [Blastocatellia bacterium]